MPRYYVLVAVVGVGRMPVFCWPELGGCASLHPVHLHVCFHLDPHVPSWANLHVLFPRPVLLAVAVLFCHEKPSTGLLYFFFEMFIACLGSMPTKFQARLLQCVLI